MIAVEIKTRRNRREESAAKRRILEAAEQLFAETGFSGASMQRIADRAKVDKKLIYYYFPARKEGLYHAVFRGFWDQMGSLVFDAEFAEEPNVEKLAVIADRLTEYAAAHPRQLRILLHDLADQGLAIHALAGERVGMIVDAAIANLAHYREEGQFPDLDPRHFLISFGGLCLGYFLATAFLGEVLGEDFLAPAHVEKHKAEVRRLLLRGIKPRGEHPLLEDDGEADLGLEALAGALDPDLMARIGELTRDEGNQTRERLLLVAEEMFADRGFAGATTQDIADRAHVDKRLLFYYFADKEELHRTVVLRFLVKHMMFQADASNWKGNAEETHGRFVEGFHNFAGANPRPVKIFLRDMLENGATCRRVFGGVVRALLEIGSRGVRRDQQLGRIAEFDPLHYQICVMSIALFHFLAADFFGKLWETDMLSPERIRERTREMTRLIWGGLTPAE